MLRVSTFMYSEDSIAEPTPQGPRTNLVNPQLVFRPMFIPSLFSFAITFGVAGFDPSLEHKMRFMFISPEGEALLDTEFDLPKSDEKPELPIEQRGIMMNMNLRNVPFKSEGIYDSEVFMNGGSLGKFPIYVKVKES